MCVGHGMQAARRGNHTLARRGVALARRGVALAMGGVAGHSLTHVVYRRLTERGLATTPLLSLAPRLGFLEVRPLP